jgi:hypothetical protein
MSPVFPLPERRNLPTDARLSENVSSCEDPKLESQTQNSSLVLISEIPGMAASSRHPPARLAFRNVTALVASHRDRWSSG